MNQQLKLWYISRKDRPDWDEFDSAVVAAHTEEEAIKTHPSGEKREYWNSDDWCSSPEEVLVKYIGIAADNIEPGVIASSFNAG